LLISTVAVGSRTMTTTPLWTVKFIINKQQVSIEKFNIKETIQQQTKLMPVLEITFDSGMIPIWRCRKAFTQYMLCVLQNNVLQWSHSGKGVVRIFRSNGLLVNC
jgi:hypothetical protein